MQDDNRRCTETTDQPWPAYSPARRSWNKMASRALPRLQHPSGCRSRLAGNMPRDSIARKSTRTKPPPDATLPEQLPTTCNSSARTLDSNSRGAGFARRTEQPTAVTVPRLREKLKAFWSRSWYANPLRLRQNATRGAPSQLRVCPHIA